MNADMRNRGTEHSLSLSLFFRGEETSTPPPSGSATVFNLNIVFQLLAYI